jgi:hypothetical protein
VQENVRERGRECVCKRAGGKGDENEKECVQERGREAES